MFRRLANPYRWVAFEGDGGVGGGAPDPAATPNNANPGGQQGGSGGSEAKFTQAELDRIVGERAKRAEETAVAKLLKEMGVEKADELKTVVAEHKKAEDARKSELEKAQGLLTSAEKARDDAKAESERLKAELQAERIQNAIIAKAAELGFEVPADAFALLDRSGVEIKDGKVSGYEKGLEELAKSGRLKMTGQRQSANLGTPPRKSAPSGAPPAQPAEGQRPVVRL